MICPVSSGSLFRTGSSGSSRGGGVGNCTMRPLLRAVENSVRISSTEKLFPPGV